MFESPVRLEMKLDSTLDWNKAFSQLGTMSTVAGRGIAKLLTHRWRYNRDPLRAANELAAALVAEEHMNDDATPPDFDWLTEAFDLASRRSRNDWKLMIGKIIARESNLPGTVPGRYLFDIARLDNKGLTEFIQLCKKYYVPRLQRIIVHMDDPVTKQPLTELNLVSTSILDTGIDLQAALHQIYTDFRSGLENRVAQLPPTFHCIPFNFLSTPQHRDRAVVLYLSLSDRPLPVGNIHLTGFGEFVHSLLDPVPTADEPHPDLRELWKDFICDGTATKECFDSYPFLSPQGPNE